MAATREFLRIAPTVTEETQTNLNQSIDLKMLFVDFVDAHGIIKQLSITQ